MSAMEAEPFTDMLAWIVGKLAKNSNRNNRILGLDIALQLLEVNENSYFPISLTQPNRVTRSWNCQRAAARTAVTASLPSVPGEVHPVSSCLTVVTVGAPTRYRVCVLGP